MKKLTWANLIFLSGNTEVIGQKGPHFNFRENKRKSIDPVLKEISMCKNDRNLAASLHWLPQEAVLRLNPGPLHRWRCEPAPST